MVSPRFVIGMPRHGTSLRSQFRNRRRAKGPIAISIDFAAPSRPDRHRYDAVAVTRVVETPRSDMRARMASKTRWRASRATPRDEEPQRRVSAGRHWAGPGRRARVLAAVLAIAFAVITFAVVGFAWRRAAPPPRPISTSVEVKLVPASPAPLPQASR
jgi:hypothetical protein